MAISAVDKNKINKYIRAHALGDMYYLDLCDALGKRGKIRDVEFLDYFTDFVVHEFQKSEKISIKHLMKILFIIENFLGWTHESDTKIKEETLDKIRNFKDFYNEYLNRNKMEEDLEFIHCIESVLKTLHKFYPCSEKNESTAKYISRILELESMIKELKKELAEVTRLYNNLQISYQQKNEEVDSLGEEIISLRDEKKSSIKEVNRLNEILNSLKNRISELEILLLEADEKNRILEPYKEQYETLAVEVEKLRNVFLADLLAKENSSNLKKKQAELEALIYQKLLFERVSIDEILRYAMENGFVSDRNEILRLLKKIKNRIHIDNSSFSFVPTYKIVAPTISSGKPFTITIPKGCKCYDIMLVSDFHIRNVNHEVLTSFDKLNDYCVKNGIHIILNLGDFYHGLGGLDYESAIKNYKIVEQSISLIPRADGLYHGILGGNHDKKILKYGFDPIEFLSSEREDFLHLGYTHSTITLTNSTHILGKFDIHHPDVFDFPVDIDENGIDTLSLERYLNTIYHNQGRNREESYIDIIGHTHKSQFNYLSSYCYIPYYFGEEIKRGACHLKIYFDEDMKIKYMIFIPLSFYSELVKNNEIIYKKPLIK